MELFRIEEGLLAEHWDAIQEDPTLPSDKITLTGGTTKVTDLPLTASNKSTVTSFYEEVMVNRNGHKLSQFVAPDLIQHTPSMAQGITGLQAYLKQPKNQWKVEIPTRIQGEGNFVWVQTKGIISSTPHAIYDLFRLHENLIVEQWRVQQAIPPQMMHENGMI